jgi:hypothetical protein
VSLISQPDRYVRSGMAELVTLIQLIASREYLTERWVRSMVARRDPSERLPHYKPGGRLLFDPDEVDAWMRRAPVGVRTGAAERSEVVLPSVATAKKDEGPPVAPGEPSR